MNEFHIGEEIRREVKRQGLSETEVADKLCIARQSVFDIYKRRHIATDQLAKLCKILNRDFFQDLSAESFGVAEIEEDEAEIKEQVSALLPEDELRMFHINYMAHDVIDEYLAGERKKPLVLFYAVDDDEILDKFINQLMLNYGEAECEDTSRDLHRDIMFQDWGDGLKIKQCPLFTSLTYTGGDYQTAIGNIEELMSAPGRHVILFLPARNELNRGRLGGLVYEDIADDLFRVWRQRAHVAVIENLRSRYQRNREYYLAYRGEGAIDRLVRDLNARKDVDRRILDLVLGQGLLDVVETMPEDSTGLSRITLRLPVNSSKGKELMFDNGVNNSPLTEMWIELRNGFIVDFQYHKRN